MKTKKGSVSFSCAGCGRIKTSMVLTRSRKQEKKLKVYIAGSWTERERVREYMHELLHRESLQPEITHNWTRAEVDDIEIRNRAANRKCASQDIDGVKNADVVIVLIENPKYAYRGTSCEIGCALGLEKPVLVYHPLKKSYMMTNLFLFHPLVEIFSDFEKLVEKLENFPWKNI